MAQWLRRAAGAAVIVAAAFSPGYAAPAEETSTTAAPLLTLEAAVAEAQAHNRLVQNSALEVAKQEDRAAALRTSRLPQFKLQLMESLVLDAGDFTIPAGTLGVFSGMALPPSTTLIDVPTGLSSTLLASVNQPITQQYRIGLGLELHALGRDLADEQLRAERQRVASEVRGAYYQLAALQDTLTAQRAAVRTLREMDQLTTRYLAEQLALRSDALEVKSRLAKEEWRLMVAEGACTTARDHLNELLGRDLSTPFRVAELSTLAAHREVGTLDAARGRAAERRPEIREARLKARQAEVDLRLTRADWIPDVTLSFNYLAMANVAILPDHVAQAGVSLSWEPFEWGRRGHEAAEREKTIAQARRGREEAEQQVAVEVGMRWRKVEEAAKLLEASELAVQASRENLEIVTARYREDAKILRDVLQAEAQLSGARHDRSDASADYWTAVAEFERAIGDD